MNQPVSVISRIAIPCKFLSRSLIFTTAGVDSGNRSSWAASGKVLERKERQRIFNYSTIGVLFFFMIFFLIFWSFTRKDILMLLFALTTMGILIRSVNTGLYFSNSFVDTPWAWQIRMEYLGSYLAHVVRDDVST